MTINNYIKISILSIFIAQFFISCSSNEQTAENKITEQPKSIEILTLTPEQQFNLTISLAQLSEEIVDKTVKLNGKMTVPPNYTHSISSLYGGHIKNINVISGMKFKKGQILATLEDPKFIQLQEDYLNNAALLKTASLNFERQRELNIYKAASDKTYEAAALEFKKLSISNKALAEKLKLIGINPNTLEIDKIQSQIHIVAPFNGIVSEVLVNKGQYVSPTDRLFELLDPSGLLANFKVFEIDLSHIQIGQQIAVSTNSMSNKKYLAKVITINPQVNADGATDIFAHIQDLDNQLVSGLFINGMITIQKQATQVLPAECVISFENKEFIWEKLEDGKFKLLAVTAGTQHNDFIEIKSSVDLNGRSFVKKGAYDLLMALKNKTEE